MTTFSAISINTRSRGKKSSLIKTDVFKLTKSASFTPIPLHTNVVHLAWSLFLWRNYQRWSWRRLWNYSLLEGKYRVNHVVSESYLYSKDPKEYHFILLSFGNVLQWISVFVIIYIITLFILYDFNIICNMIIIVF